MRKCAQPVYKGNITEAVIKIYSGISLPLLGTTFKPGLPSPLAEHGQPKAPEISSLDPPQCKVAKDHLNLLQLFNSHHLTLHQYR